MNIYIDIIKDGFYPFKTEHQTVKYLNKINCLFLPKQIIVNSIVSFKTTKKQRLPHVQDQTISIIPLKLVLKRFLEVSDIYVRITSYIEHVTKSKSFVSVCQTDFWKSAEETASGKFILPLVLYFDDLEINNPLGSRKTINKIGAVYCSIASLPREFSSLLENIFVVQLHKYQHHKSLGNKRMFIHVINQINKLCTKGISINVEGQTKQVYFILSHIMGDNLGLNTILGFIKNFNSSHCCRICYMSKDEIRISIRSSRQ